MATPTLTIDPRIRESADTLRYEFDLSWSASARRETLFYEMARAEAPAVPDNFDGVLCATVLRAMADRCDIRLRGPATSAGLRNLAEFQLAWSRWLPAEYEPIAIEPDSVIDIERPQATRSLAAFSGGVDSSYTLLSHADRRGPADYPLDTVLLVYGFDVTRGNARALHELITRTEPLRRMTGVQLRIVCTNSKELRLQPWQYSFGAELAACLHLFSAEFTHGLVGSSEPYDALVLPWGSNPVTDHLLSGGAFGIVHDGAGFSRTDKIAVLARCPAAVQSLKVCWQGKEQGRNCGSCEKCVRTRLNFLAVGVADPPCFDGPLELRRVDALAITNDAVLAEFRSIVDYAERRQIDAPWLHALRKRLSRGQRNWTLRRRARTSLARVGLLGTARRLREQFLDRRMA